MQLIIYLDNVKQSLNNMLQQKGLMWNMYIPFILMVTLKSSESMILYSRLRLYLLAPAKKHQKNLPYYVLMQKYDSKKNRHSTDQLSGKKKYLHYGCLWSGPWSLVKIHNEEENGSPDDITTIIYCHPNVGVCLRIDLTSAKETPFIVYRLISAQ